MISVKVLGMAYSDFLRALDEYRARTAQFYRADLHVHTHDSPDFPSSQELTPEQLGGQLTEAETARQSSGTPVPLEEYLERVRTCDPRLDIVVITDHEVCDIACELAGTCPPGHLVLPGIEIKARISQVSRSDVIHVLCIFDPSKNPATIWNHVAPTAAQQYRAAVGQPFEIFDLPAYIGEHIHQNNGLCIAAHVDQENGIRKYFFSLASRRYIEFDSRRRALEKARTELGAVLARREDASATLELRAIETRIAELDQALEQTRKELKTMQYSLQEEFLQLVSRSCFHAIQVQKPVDGQHYAGEHTRALGVLPIATILASDAHFLGDIGRKSSWVKMAGLSFDGLRRALEFPVCRVRLGEYRKPNYPKILGIRFVPDAGAPAFFQTNASKFTTVAFADNLNCLIGGRGSGKSAIIDALKLLFKGRTPAERNQAARLSDPEDETVRRLPDWMQRLVATMQGTKIEAALQYERPDGSCERFVVSLPFDFRFAAREIVRGPDGADTGLLATDPRLEVDVYGWSEVEALGASREAQRELIDRFAQTGQFQNDIADVLKRLAANRQLIRGLAEEAEGMANTEELTQYVQRRREFDYYNRPEIAAVFGEADALDKQHTVLTGFRAEIERLLEGIKSLQVAESVEKACSDVIEAFLETGQGSDEVPPSEAGSGTPTGSSQGPNGAHPWEALLFPQGSWLELVRRSAGIGDVARLVRVRNVVAALLGEVELYVTGSDTELTRLKAALAAKLAGVSAQAEGKDAMAREARQRARQRYEASKGKLDELERKLAEVVQALQVRSDLKAAFDEATRKRTAARRNIVAAVNERLDKAVNSPRIAVRIDLEENCDRTGYINLMLQFLGRTKQSIHHKDTKAALLAKLRRPEEIKRALLDTREPEVFVLDGDRTEERIPAGPQAEAIVRECAATRDLNLSDDGVDTVEYYDPDRLDQVLQLDEVILDDLPSILLNMSPAAGGQFAPIAGLSPGQRCSALLPIILLRGSCPLVIDQPEDNLDNRLICDVVVDVLQRLKEQRQIVVATHNPNIPVSADAEQVIVMEALSRDRGTIARQGPIDDEQIIRSVKEIMEGGEEAFRLRARRYNYDLTPRRPS